MDRVLGALEHRGPDAHGAWKTSVRPGWTLHLLHTRLSIIDLSDAAAQPMALVRAAGDDGWRRERLPAHGSGEPGGSAADRLICIFNGEIYNFRRLRADLEARGHEFLSSGDTEVLLRGYAEWGAAVFDRCDGIYATAIYDSRSGKLVLARDHAGIKPLYWSRTSEGGLVFASEVRALAAAGVVNLTVDPLAVADYLRAGSFQEPATVYAEVRMFPANARVAIDAKERLSELPLAVTCGGAENFRPTGRIDTLEAARREHGNALSSTIHEQLVADVPVGLFLSGGLDSTVLLQGVPAEDRERVTAFTLAGEATADDEAETAAATCKALGVRHKVVGLSIAQLNDWMGHALDAMDQPSCDGANIYLVSRASRAAGLVVVLSGCGADELHGAYGHASYLASMVRRSRRLGPLMRPLQRLRAAVSRARGIPVSDENLRSVLSAIPDVELMLREARSFMSEAELKSFWPGAPIGNHRVPTSSADVEPLELETQVMMAEYAGYLRNTLLRDSDWASMANHQELRVPFLGRRYVETTLSIPWACRAAQPGSNKPLLTSVLAPEIAHLSKKPKKGFVLNYAGLLNGPMRSDFDAACSRLEETLGIKARPGPLLAAIDTPGHGPRYTMRLWSLLALGRYLKKHT